MTYVITSPSVGTKDRARVEEGPVDCSYAALSETLQGRDMPLRSPGDTAKLEPVAAKPRWWPGLPPHPMTDDNDE